MIQVEGRTDLDAGAGKGAFSDAVASRGGFPAFVHVNHSAITGNSASNMMHAARRSVEARGVLDDLTNAGYYLYLAKSGESRLVHHGRVKNLWKAVVDGQFQINDHGIVYRFEPALNGNSQRLVVVFSPMSVDPFETSINRYFVQTYPSLIKFLPPGTAVLRVGDLGGVKGAFYLNTSYLPENAPAVAEFISDFVSNANIPREQVVFYGPSKGGTGSFFHSLNDGWHVVAVDPITADDIYVEQHGDAHFVLGGIFPQSKNEVFADAISRANRTRDDGQWQRVIITSTNSPQKAFTDDHIAPMAHQVTVVDSRNPEITGHPSVARNTLWAQVMAMNAILTGIALPKGTLLTP